MARGSSAQDRKTRMDCPFAEECKPQSSKVRCRSMANLKTASVFVIFMVTNFLRCTVNSQNGSSPDLTDAWPNCNYCTTVLCGSCDIRFDTSSLLWLNLNISCENAGSQSFIISPNPGDILDLKEAHSTCKGYKLSSTNGCLISLPDNYCDYPAIKVLDLYGNKLATFPNLSCLPELALLDLRYNLIRTVPREAFAVLRNLREVYLDYNQIVFMDPFTFDVPLPRITWFTMSNNKLKTAEIWFVSIDHTFCVFDFSNNIIENLTNEKNITYSKLTGKNIGTGFVNFANNRITHPLAILELIGKPFSTKILTLSIFFDSSLDFRGNPVYCDCSLYELLLYGAEVIKYQWRDYFQVQCNQPDTLRGVFVTDLRLDQLVCDIANGCPKGCTCQDRPAKGHILIDCVSAGWEKLPETMPEGRDLNLLFQNNSIKVLESRDYLPRVQHIDLRENGLRLITDDVPKSLKCLKLLDLRDNDLRQLPNSIQELPKDKVLFDSNEIYCHCDMQWFQVWVSYSGTSHSTSDRVEIVDDNNSSLTNEAVLCTLVDGTRISTTEDMNQKLSCFPTTMPAYFYVILAAMATILLLSVVLAIMFRYEMKVLYQWISFRFSAAAKDRQFKNLVTSTGDMNVPQNDSQIEENVDEMNIPHHLYSHDVFISADSNDSSDLQWIRSTLIPELESRAIKSYLPVRDSLPGEVAIEESLKQMKASATVLVVLSNAYAVQQACLFQFSQAYSVTLGACGKDAVLGRRRRLLVVQIDPLLRQSHVADKKIKAMMRLNMTYLVTSAADLETVLLKIKQ